MTEKAPPPGGDDEDLRRACREVVAGGRPGGVIIPAFLYAAIAVAVHVTLAPSLNVIVTVSVMFLLLLGSTALAAGSVHAMRRSVEWLKREQDLDLPRRLGALREAQFEHRHVVLDELAGRLAETEKDRVDSRVKAAARRLRVLVMVTCRGSTRLCASSRTISRTR